MTSRDETAIEPPGVGVRIHLAAERTESLAASRDTAIDVCRGIGILLVVIGHARPPTDLVNYIYQFHMPLFFFISGVLFKADQSFPSSLSRRIQSLYIPFVKYELAFMLLRNVFLDWGIYPPGSGMGQVTSENIITIVSNILTFNQTELMAFPFWFLCSLFSVHVLLSAFHAAGRFLPRHRPLIVALCVAVATAGGFYLTAKGILIRQNTVNATLVCLAFFYAGTLYGTFKHRIKHSVPIALAAGALLLAGVSSRIDVSTFVFGNPAVFMAKAFLGIYLVMTLSLWLCRKAGPESRFVAGLVFFGQQTMPIMAFQYLGFEIGRAAASIYGATQIAWVFASVFGVAAPILISLALRSVGVDARTLSLSGGRPGGVRASLS